MPLPNENQLAGELLAASIHEIKNRFGILFSQLDQLLATLPLTNQHQHSADQIKSEGQFIGSELVRILASYKTLEQGASANVDQQFLLDFLEEKVARHAYTAAANNLQIAFDCDDQLTGFFDAGIVSIVLDTAIYNAVTERVSRILLSADIGEHELLIQIHDNGKGFPVTMLGQPSSQGNLKAETGSTGLGLFFAQRLLGSHREGERQGRLTLDKSDRLGGACVTLHLPL